MTRKERNEMNMLRMEQKERMRHFRSVPMGEKNVSAEKARILFILKNVEKKVEPFSKNHCELIVTCELIEDGTEICLAFISRSGVDLASHEVALVDCFVRGIRYLWNVLEEQRYMPSQARLIFNMKKASSVPIIRPPMQTELHLEYSSCSIRMGTKKRQRTRTPELL